MEAVMKVASGVGQVELREIGEPVAGSNEVLIEVGAAGICGTDLHIYHGEFTTRPPVVMGHEIAGTVVAVGREVTGLMSGARVTTETYFSTCGACRYCRNGRVNLCPERRSIGSAVDGGFADYLVVPAHNVHVLPENISVEAGALSEPLACVVHGVLTYPTVRPGELAVIAGPGSIGLLTLQVVKAAGAIPVVLGTDADAARLDLARKLGAHTFNVQAEDPGPLLRDLSSGGYGADVVYECSGADLAAHQLLELVRRGGRYVQIGLFGKPVGWDLDQVCYKELVVTGSNASTPESWLRALALLESGQVQTEPLISGRYRLRGWQEAFETFEARRGVKLMFTPGA